jgi:tartrate/fumarate subfamily iron-sulfur-dependent hydro-lyase beta chain
MKKMSTVYLDTPLNDSDVEKLNIGDILYLSGTIYTSRDMGHLRMAEYLNKEKSLPVDLKGNVIFHAGPVVIKKDEQWELSVIGPTTSIRMEPYAEMIGELGVKMIIGKGGMGDNSLNCFNKYKQVYLQGPPGCAVKLGSNVKRIKEVHWLEMGMPEALWVLEVEKFGPLIVSMDSHYHSLHSRIKEKAYDIISRMF